MERLHAVLERGALVGVYVGGAMLFAAAGLIAVEVVGRKFLGFSTSGADELSGYAYGLSMAWGYAYVLFRRGHLRIDTVYVRLSRRARAALDVLALLAFAALVGLLVVRGAEVLAESLAINAKSNTPLSIPLWIPQSIWIAGLGFFLASLVVVFLRAARAWAVGDLDQVRRLAEVPDAVEAELGHKVDRVAPPGSRVF